MRVDLTCRLFMSRFAFTYALPHENLSPSALKLSSLPFFRWSYNTFLRAFITSDLAAYGEPGERQKDDHCEAEEVACVTPDREHN